MEEDLKRKTRMHRGELSAVMRSALTEDGRSRIRLRFESRMKSHGLKRLGSGKYGYGDLFSVSCQRPTEITKEVNGPLWIMFDFYNKLQTPGQQLARRGVTYDEIRSCNERMSWFELLHLSRDMGIVPALITKTILEHIWRQCVSSDKQQQGQIHTRSLSLEGFIEVFARAALAAFPQKKSQEAVEALIQRLQLHDERIIRARVRFKGRETQRKLYFRSKGERTAGAAQALLNEKHATMRLDSPSKQQQVHNLDYISLHSLHTNTAWQTRLQHDYNPGLKEQMRPFCFSNSSHQWLNSEDFAFDLGTFPPDCTETARLEIMNTSGSIFVITGISQSADTIRASFDPKPVAAGLCRHIDLTFRKPDDVDDLELEGILNINLRSCGTQPRPNFSSTHGNCTQNEEHITISVPYYFRISSFGPNFLSSTSRKGKGRHKNKRQEQQLPITNQQRGKSSLSSMVARLPDNKNCCGYSSSSSSDDDY